MMEIAYKIRHFRTKHGLSRKQLSEQLGVSQQVISQWEIGQTTPESDSISKMASIFNVNASILLSSEEVDGIEIFNFIENMLKDNEVVLWQAQPNLHKNLTKSDIFLIPFSIFWFGFCILWTILAFSSFPVFALFGIPFLLIGVYLTFGRFYFKKYNKKHTYYALTNKRLLIIHKIRGERIFESTFNTLNGINYDADKHGCGTIHFGENRNYPFNNISTNNGMDFFNKNLYNYAFYDIDDAKNVYQLISDLVENTSTH